jgi:N,N'-diacetylchitobiose phosphorylase
LHLKNETTEDLDLSLFSYAEFSIFDAANDRDNYQYTYNIATCYKEDSYIFHDTLYCLYKIIAYHCSSHQFQGFDCDREDFIGPYNTEANPRGVLAGRLNNKNISGGNPCGALHVDLSLSEGKEEDILFIIGIEETKEAIKKVSQRYFSPGYTEERLQEVKDYWRQIFDRFIIETPSSEINSFINVWNPYQIRTTFYLSRGASIYEGGIRRGMGYRDSNQDTLGPAYQLDDELHGLLSELLSFQYEDGKACHGYFKMSREGYGEDPYSDDHLWLILSITNYIKESGDTAFLDKKIPYYESTKEGTVFQHMEQALEFSRVNYGDHHIPLAFHADWNDCLNLRGPRGKGESVWVGFLYHRALLEFIELCRMTGKEDRVKKYEEDARKIKEIINSHAWDGYWYVRAFDDNGRVIGSNKNKYGKIFLNAQSWAVYSGVASLERGKCAMDMVRKHCFSEHGLALLWPAFREYDRSIGSITFYPPGLKENAGIFCHANTWAILAECILGRGDIAMEYYMRLLPPHANEIATLHKSEPYVYAQVIAGPEHQDFGLARNSWLTGTASWMFYVFTHYILGIRPFYNGLIIDPCIPSYWEGFTAKRQFRKTMYTMTVKNPEKICGGVKTIAVDGKVVQGNIVPLTSGKEVKVEVVLGK